MIPSRHAGRLVLLATCASLAAGPAFAQDVGGDPLVASQSFSFLSKAAAQAVMTRKQNQMLSARDRAASQIDGLDAALDELMSNRLGAGVIADLFGVAWAIAAVGGLTFTSGMVVAVVMDDRRVN